MKIKTLLVALALIPFTANAKIVMPAIFSDNMVLQQQTDAAIWGQAAPKSLVSITPSWSKTMVSVKADGHGEWKAALPTPGAGGPYEIRISDSEGTLSLKNVLIGEVWFCSGQSNMEEPVKGYEYQPVNGSTDAIIGARPSTPIRMCEIKKGMSITPLSECTTQWNEHTPEAVANTSATAYFFGSYLQKHIDVPVGLVVTDWGGTKIESWMNKETLQKTDTDLSGVKEDGIHPNMPTVLYNAMVAPIVPFSVKGFIWYQGESNIKGPESGYYTGLQTAYVQMMRELFGDGSSAQPFYFVQIAPFGYGGDGRTSAYLREAQAACLKTIPNCGMATTVDVGEVGCIHPAAKPTIGRRLALLALQNTYGFKEIEANPGQFKSVEFRDGFAYVSLDMGKSTFGPYGAEFTGFEVAGEDKVFHKAKAIVYVDYNAKPAVFAVEVNSPDVPNPVAVRYCFDDTSAGNLVNQCGIPVAPFRSDNW